MPLARTMKTRSKDKDPFDGRRRKKASRMIKQQEQDFPMQIATNLLLLELGNIDFEREQFHNERYIYPIGFKSEREYCSYIKGDGSRTLYRSEIIDGGDRPIFTVVASDDPDTIHSSPTVSGCWISVIKRVKDVLKNRATTSISGPSCFGLSNPDVKKLIEKLPNAQKCMRYFKEQVNKKDVVMETIEESSPTEMRKSTRKRTKRSWDSDYEEDLIIPEEQEEEEEKTPKKRESKRLRGENPESKQIVETVSPTPRRRRIIRHHGRTRATSEIPDIKEVVPLVESSLQAAADASVDVAPADVTTMTTSSKSRGTSAAQPVVFDEEDYDLDFDCSTPLPISQDDSYEYDETFSILLGDTREFVASAVPQPLFLGSADGKYQPAIKEEFDDVYTPFEEKIRRFCRIAE
jgi:hypothetical protein